jgi:hypothetical protein
MKRFAAVALREVVERRFVLVAAAGASLIPLLVPFLPGVPGDGSTATGVSALMLACAFGLGGALLVGASVVGRELGEKRLSFHFSRPLPSAVIWGGKLVGGLALVLLAEAIVVLPALAVRLGPNGLWGGFLDLRVVAALLLLVVPLFLLAWVGSVALRSRSPWLAVDFVLLAAFPAVLYALGRRLLLYGQLPSLTSVIVGAGVLLATLFAATFAQVAAGRTDARRGHGAQSVILWGALGAALIALSLWVERKVDPGFRSFVTAATSPAGSNGDWVLLEGTPKVADDHRRARYLVDLRTGRSLLLPVSFGHVVSGDGSRATWIGPVSPFDKGPRRTVLNLSTGRSTDYPIGLAEFELALSVDGRRLASLSNDGVCEVIELESGRLLASVKIPGIEPWFTRVAFQTGDIVRIEPIAGRPPEGGLRQTASPLPPVPALFLLDVPARKVTAAARAVTPSPRVQRVFGSPGRWRAFVRRSEDRDRLHLLDLASGSVLASFGERDVWFGSAPRGGALADGRFWVLSPSASGWSLSLLSPDGALVCEVRLPTSSEAWNVGFEVAPGVLTVSIPPWVRNARPRCLLVDLNTGTTREAGPLHALESRSLAIVAPPPGSPVTRLFAEHASGRLLLYDPSTGATTPLTRGRPSGK